MAQEKHSVEDEDHHHYHGVDRAEEHVSVNDALKILLASIRETKPESITLPESCGRILYEEIMSPANLPKLARSTRDGYAVNINENIVNDTEYYAYRIVGEVKIGTAPRIKIGPGEAARVATGSYIPADANAVIMVEYSNVENGVLRFAHPLRIGENIVSPGEDIKKGELLLSRGSRVHPQHLALFSILGVNRLRVYSKPRVAVLSTGDELKDSPSWAGRGGRKREKANRKSLLTFDSNRPFLKLMLAELGAEPVDLGITPDNFQKIRSKLVKSLECDAVILSAGSSVGERDYVTRALE
ncbi:MAG: molybdopterin molybdotransferase MoeA, partial [Thaumarchaeota archaeon]|nr:molybdopterin molybdotransferase MoeA [Nitrososphaerota archaeon]